MKRPHWSGVPWMLPERIGLSAEKAMVTSPVANSHIRHIHVLLIIVPSALLVQIQFVISFQVQLLQLYIALGVPANAGQLVVAQRFDLAGNTHHNRPRRHYHAFGDQRPRRDQAAGPDLSMVEDDRAHTD